ncbi:MAG: ubiquitin-like domain-containing protein, partial [Chloroflexia bacterium]
RNVQLEADGRVLRFQTRARTVEELLRAGGVSLAPGDIVQINGQPFPESALEDERALQVLLDGGATSGLLAPSLRPSDLHVRVTRAVPVLVVDDGWPLEIRTTAATVGEALESARFRLHRADRVEPELDAPIVAGLQVHIQRARPAWITVDGRSWQTYSRAATVGELLAEEGVELSPLDRVEPPADTAISPGLRIRIVRVTTLDMEERVPIPFRRLQQADPSMALDEYRLRPGEPGWKETITRITYEDGREVGREYLGERVVKEPVDQILYYGTKIVIRSLDTPYGQIEYWRKIRVLATSYYPSTCDKSPTDPTYGITYTGKRATRGIIAVDPRVIPLHTRLYVPGYGIGAAEDIGGKVKGKHIDLCFDDEDRGKNLWSTRYVDVYLLTPVPPLNRIPWVIP